MRKLAMALMAAILVGCGEMPENNFNYAVETMHQAEKDHPDKDFGMIEEDPNKVEYLAMTAQGWSSYMTIERYPGRGGWGWVIMSRHKKNAGKQ